MGAGFCRPPLPRSRQCRPRLQRPRWPHRSSTACAGPGGPCPFWSTASTWRSQPGVSTTPDLRVYTREDRISPLSLFWSTADGAWFRVHGEYPWHRDRALAVLGCEDSHRSVKRAVATWRAEDLEDALAAAGAVGYAVRTSEQWESHPHGRTLTDLPLLETRVGEGPARTAGEGRAAEGVRVLDLTRVLAGPIATRTLAAWGADVLRLDSPRLPELTAHAVDTLSGKRSAELDLTEPAGRTRLEELLSSADLLVQGYRPGALARFGLTQEALAQRHPHLSVVTLSAWGPGGPWSQRRGFDSLVQCVTGIALTEGSSDRPGWLPAQVLDHATGYLAAAAGLMALASAQRDGRPGCCAALARSDGALARRRVDRWRPRHLGQSTLSGIGSSSRVRVQRSRSSDLRDVSAISFRRGRSQRIPVPIRRPSHRPDCGSREGERGGSFPWQSCRPHVEN